MGGSSIASTFLLPPPPTASASAAAAPAAVRCRSAAELCIRWLGQLRAVHVAGRAGWEELRALLQHPGVERVTLEGLDLPPAAASFWPLDRDEGDEEEGVGSQAAPWPAWWPKHLQRAPRAGASEQPAAASSDAPSSGGEGDAAAAPRPPPVLTPSWTLHGGPWRTACLVSPQLPSLPSLPWPLLRTAALRGALHCGAAHPMRALEGLRAVRRHRRKLRLQPAQPADPVAVHPLTSAWQLLGSCPPGDHQAPHNRGGGAAGGGGGASTLVLCQGHTPAAEALRFSAPGPLLQELEAEEALLWDDSSSDGEEEEEEAGRQVREGAARHVGRRRRQRRALDGGAAAVGVGGVVLLGVLRVLLGLSRRPRVWDGAAMLGLGASGRASGSSLFSFGSLMGAGMGGGGGGGAAAAVEALELHVDRPSSAFMRRLVALLQQHHHRVLRRRRERAAAGQAGWASGGGNDGSAEEEEEGAVEGMVRMLRLCVYALHPSPSTGALLPPGGEGTAAFMAMGGTGGDGDAAAAARVAAAEPWSVLAQGLPPSVQCLQVGAGLFACSSRPKAGALGYSCGWCCGSCGRAGTAPTDTHGRSGRVPIMMPHRPRPRRCSCCTATTCGRSWTACCCVSARWTPSKTWPWRRRRTGTWRRRRAATGG